MDFLTQPWAHMQALLDWRNVPLDLASLTALAAGLGWASGLRLYALVFILGALARFGHVQLPGGLMVLAHPVVLGISGALLCIEFFADKIPWLDSVWDVVHTFIRIPAGAALAAAAFGDQTGALQVGMGLLGGSLAASTHFAKTGARAAINASPEPFTNVLTSLAEDSLFAGGMWLMLNHPIWFLGGLGVFTLFAVSLLVVLWRLGKRWMRRAPSPQRA